MNGRLRRRLAGRAPGRAARLRVAPRACAIVRTPERTATRACLACLACAACAARAPQAGRRAYASSAPPLPFDFTR
ncbi:hypothetical protein [Burkholderia pseudomallei]|uniref:hypothetical protein n=1 Tax=Burkholderia pseudomallei TaxID=28450 RepID=UPI000976F98C|nr:hypothetical protein [Burkholderia pseudomallei]AUG23315.1 hypothetical protein CXQ84_22090 [Burkholderia pseudomallei]UZU17215.1 hypothetical protein OSB53_26235 [Burkholderia pseudomallei]UZU20453.1 hypothetical protein OSB35_00350 [Burkholderia pseudomallei]UZU26365.1 hypothetical protein OSB54_00350 [Burkholderia pseudomallei]